MPGMLLEQSGHEEQGGNQEEKVRGVMRNPVSSTALYIAPRTLAFTLSEVGSYGMFLSKEARSSDSSFNKIMETIAGKQNKGGQGQFG